MIPRMARDGLEHLPEPQSDMCLRRHTLDRYLGRTIGQICPNGYARRTDNHCAHFVSHVLGFRFGTTCNIKSRGFGRVANIKVWQLFNRCPVVGPWTELSRVLIYCLVFISRANNVDLATRSFKRILPHEHVGIYLEGLIWHYSNSHHRVVRQTPEQFSQHFPSPEDNALFFGEIPWVPDL